MITQEMLRLSGIIFKGSCDGTGWIATDGVRCITAPTIAECAERAARIVNWGTGEFPCEEQRNSVDKRLVNR